MIPGSVTNIGSYAFLLLFWANGCDGTRQRHPIGNLCVFRLRKSAPCIFPRERAKCEWQEAGSADTTDFPICRGGRRFIICQAPKAGTPPLAGWPTVLWNPQVQTTDNNFGVKGNKFGFNLAGTANDSRGGGSRHENLKSALGCRCSSGSVTNGSIYFSDPQWTNYPQRFYHVRSP